MISKTYKSDLTLHLDIRSVFDLCKGGISPSYIIEALEPSENKDVLVTIFTNKASDIIGIRTTNIHRKTTYQITGVYACSNGYGELLQKYTETLIRENVRGMFAIPKSATLPVSFTLAALPSSQGFWTRIGFEDTGKKDVDGNTIMRKRMYPSDDESTTTKRTRVRSVRSNSKS
jgi:hypothetical protein